MPTKIKREHGDFDEIVFYLRLLDLTEEKKNLILIYLKNFKTNGNKMFKKKGFGVLIELPQKFNEKRLISCIKNFNVKSFDISVSFRSSYDHGGVDIPKNILKLHKKIGGGLGFSYVIA